MKKLLVVLSLILLIGCSQNPNLSQGQIKNGENIITEYFTVTVPESWDDLYEYEIYDEDINGYSLIFYEVESHKNMGAGFLMAIAIYPENEDYSYLPSYDELGMLDVGDELYNIIVEYPTDVQFDETTANKYRNLSDDLEIILDTITANDGYVYTKR